MAWVEWDRQIKENRLGLQVAGRAAGRAARSAAGAVPANIRHSGKALYQGLTGVVSGYGTHGWRNLRTAMKGTVFADGFNNGIRGVRTVYEAGLRFNNMFRQATSMSPAALAAARKWTYGVSSSAYKMAGRIYDSDLGQEMIGAAWKTTWSQLVKRGSQYAWPMPAYR